MRIVADRQLINRFKTNPKKMHGMGADKVKHACEQIYIYEPYKIKASIAEACGAEPRYTNAALYRYYALIRIAECSARWHDSGDQCLIREPRPEFGIDNSCTTSFGMFANDENLESRIPNKAKREAECIYVSQSLERWLLPVLMRWSGIRVMERSIHALRKKALSQDGAMPGEGLYLMAKEITHLAAPYATTLDELVVGLSDDFLYLLREALTTAKVPIPSALNQWQAPDVALAKSYEVVFANREKLKRAKQLNIEPHNEWAWIEFATHYLLPKLYPTKFIRGK